MSVRLGTFTNACYFGAFRLNLCMIQRTMRAWFFKLCGDCRLHEYEWKENVCICILSVWTLELLEATEWAGSERGVVVICWRLGSAGLLLLLLMLLHDLLHLLLQLRGDDELVVRVGLSWCGEVTSALL